MQKPILLTTLILLALTAGLTPTAQAATQVEDFEDDTLFNDPEGPYTFSWSSGTAGWVDNTRSLGTKSLKQNNDASHFIFDGITDFCEGYDFSFAFNLDTFLAGQSIYLGLSAGTGLTTSGSNQVRIGIADTGAVTLTTVSGAGASNSQIVPGLTLTTDTWYNVTFTSSPTTGCTNAVSVTFTDQSLGVSKTGATMTAPLDAFTAGQSSGNFPLSWFDNIAFFEAGQPGSVFCANPVETDFGYEYVEGTTHDPSIDTNFVGTQSGFVFEGDSTDSDYLAKGFNTGSQAFAVKMRLEAGSELTGEQSIFRAAFTEGNMGTPSVTNKGDGTDGGNFDDHVGVRFFENGNDWEIGIYQNVAGAGYTKIGASIFHGDPNNPTTYNFTVDSRDLTARLYSENDEGTTQTLLLTRTINAAFQDQLWEDQWFVGTGTALVNAFTYLDDNDEADNHDSTCIYDLIGGAVVTGSSGTGPGSLTPDLPDEGGEEGPLDALSESFGSIFMVGDAAGAILLAIFWILIFAAGAYGILGGSPLAIGIGALCGFVFSIFTGLIPDILVFIVVLLAAAAVGMRLFAGGGSGADG